MSPFSSFKINRMLDKDQSCARTALVGFGEFLIEAAGLNAVTTFMLNEIGTIARHAAGRTKVSDINRRAVRFIIDVLSKIKVVFEENVRSRNQEEYVECHSQIESVKTWLLKDNPEANELIEYCNNALDKFGSLEVVKETINRSLVEWPDVSAK